MVTTAERLAALGLTSFAEQIAQESASATERYAARGLGVTREILGIDDVDYLLHFNGLDNGRILLNDNSIASNTAGSLAVFASVDAFNGATANAIFDVNGTGTTGLGIWLNWLGAGRFTYGNGTMAVVGITVVPGTLHHFGVTWSGSTIKFYVDGVLVSTQSDATLVFVGVGKYLGGGDSANRALTGKAKEFRTYSVALSDGDMATLAAGGVIASNLTHHIPLNEGAGKLFHENVFDTDYSTIGDASENNWVEAA